MRVTIYEEFPNDENLEKLIQLNFPFNVIVAASNLRRFEELERQIRYTNSSVQRVGYWPVLSIDEGYWLSPFSKRVALERVIREFEERSNGEGKLLLHLDANLPFLNLKLFPKEVLHFSSNKRRISEFLSNHKNYGLDLVIAELPPFFIERFQRLLGVAFDPLVYDTEKVKLVYTSFKKYFYRFFGNRIPNDVAEWLFDNEVRKGVSKYGKRFSIVIGCLATGIFGNEPLMMPEEFEHDLRIAQENGASKIFVYRLGGINQEFASVIKSYT